jgi:putative endopeptidase
VTAAALPSGFDLHDFDDAVRPQDDLFAYANQLWLDRTEIPADRARYGTFEVLNDQSERAIFDIIEQARSAPVGSEPRKFGDLYSSFMDEERINLLGVEPVRPELDAIARITTYDELLRTIASWQRQGLEGFYQVFVNNDPGDPERNLVFFEQGGISLPDESYYREEQYDEIRTLFAAHVVRMMELADLDDSSGRAKRVLDLETEIAACHWDNVTSRDMSRTYNLVSWNEAAAMFAGTDAWLSLDAWREGFAVDDEVLEIVVLRQPSFTSDLARIFRPERLESWKDWLTWRVLSGYSPYLSSDFVNERFEFFGRTLTGAQELRDRWKRGVAFVEGAMGEAVGKIYVERYYPIDVKVRMDALVANLIGAYRESISTLRWMSEATRQRAIEKLDAFTPKVGFPVRWRDYSDLDVSSDDLIANVRAATGCEFRREIAKVGAPVDRDEWFMTPQSVNAYYNPGFNEIVFPAAILQPPFFDASRDEAANYGSIGAVIGHEIGHGFDDQGSKFDGSGRLIDWWEESDREAFDGLSEHLIEQFDGLAPREAPELRVNGALTIGENIGDLGGLGIAWKAYQLSLGAQDPPVVDGLTGAQRFFIAWAQSWRSRARAEDVSLRIAVDPHSPPELRCNQIVRNIDEFYDAFHVVAGDRLWLAPSARVTIW